MKQALENIKAMGVVSGMLGRVYMHATRYGYGREVNFCKPSEFTGGTVSWNRLIASLLDITNLCKFSVC